MDDKRMIEKKQIQRIITAIITFAVAFLLAFGTVTNAEEADAVPNAENSAAAQLISLLGGGDGLYKQGLNGFDMYDYLGYVYMGWRTTGGIWQNHIINRFILDELAKAGYATSDDNVEAPYGTKPDSDRSGRADNDYAWIIQYQETEEVDLGLTWDPEYSSLEVQLVREDGTQVEDEEGSRLAENVGGEWWAYNPTLEVYQKNFAEEFGMDYEQEIAPLPDTDARVRAMHETLMSSDVEKDLRTGVDDYKNIARSSIDRLNKEAELNKRTRLAWNSCFTDPSGTDPSEAAGLDGEFVYVGTVNVYEGTNSEGIPSEELAGKILLTDSYLDYGFTYASDFGAVGVASKADVESYLCPKDENGTILDPWYDSSRYAEGAYIEYAYEMSEWEQPIIEWQFSNQQYDSLKALLERAKKINEEAASEAERVKVTGRQIAIGQFYPMTKKEGYPGVGQAVAIAEVKGSVHPEKRIILCAHVQEPGCNDNATGVASLLEMATAYKQMVDAGEIDRPKCTITFMWGDEMNMADYWLDGHEEEAANLIGALDLDMTGEDPEKTGGVMRVERTPDPSAIYGYTLDAVPWEDTDPSIASLSNPYYDENYRCTYDDSFVRLPDSHTLWGESYVGNRFKRGWYLNDLFLYAADSVSKNHDTAFRFDVCPFEGGSDHSVFQQRQIPALLTWHFTDYVYHTSSDTLYMASPREMESVGITALATALLIGDSCDSNAYAMQILTVMEEAALERMETEKTNTEHHLQYVLAGSATREEALSNETEVLNAWGDWYAEALESVETLVDEPSCELTAAIALSKEKLAAKVQEGLDYAEELLGEQDPDDKPVPGPDDKPDPDRSGDQKTDGAVKTGDRNSMEVWILLLAAAGAGIVLAVIVRRRSGSDRK